MKHAYLIMAHNSPKVLNTLLNLLDDERNDIFLHIDKKARDIDLKSLKVQKSKLIFVKRMDCRWGEFSLVECELQLINACLKQKEKYSRIHLLSGSDLPLKNQDKIHEFFNKYVNDEFINIEDINTDECRERISWYLKDDSNNSFMYKQFCRVHNILIDRTRKRRNSRLQAVKTSQWFSITYDCAKYLWRKRRYIRRHFGSTDCPDEMFLGTTLYGTKYWENRNTLYEYTEHTMSNMRLIDWKRGQNHSPYTFRMEDIELIENSEMLFARKFSDEQFDVVKTIIDKMQKMKL